MCKRIANYCLYWVLCSLAVIAQAQSSVQVSQFQGPNYARAVVLDFGSLAGDKADRWFLHDSAPGRDLRNYRLYVVLQPDTSAMQICDASRDYLNATSPPSPCLLSTDTVPPTPAPGPLAIDSFGKMVTVPLLKPSHGGAHYILSIRSDDESLEVPFTNTTSLIVPDSAKVRTVLKVKSAINLKAAVGRSVTVSRSVAKGSTTTSENYSATISQIDNDGLVLVLRKGVAEWQNRSVAASRQRTYG